MEEQGSVRQAPLSYWPHVTRPAFLIDNGGDGAACQPETVRRVLAVPQELKSDLFIELMELWLGPKLPPRPIYPDAWSDSSDEEGEAGGNELVG